jgi:frataxin-like iron-binding protein CyaY
MRKVIVKPKSSKAKNTFVNTLNSNPVFTVEQDTGSELFLAAENRKYFFWVSTRTGTNRFGDKADAHWEIVSEIKEVI